MGEPPSALGKVKYGKDDALEELADKLLYEGVGDNKRGIDRDIEKMAYESGFVSGEGLEHYDPVNDWDTQDEVYVLFVRDIDSVEPSLCTDGNVRARSRMDPHLPDGVWGRAGAEERRGLSRHIDDDDDWGSDYESIPRLGVNEGPRKACTKCGKSKGLMLFSLDPRNKDGLRSWCKQCRKEDSKTHYARKNNKPQVDGLTIPTQ